MLRGDYTSGATLRVLQNGQTLRLLGGEGGWGGNEREDGVCMVIVVVVLVVHGYLQCVKTCGVRCVADLYPRQDHCADCPKYAV